MRIALKLALLRSGETQRAWAARLSMPEARLSSIVRGWLEPSAAERARIAAALGEPEAALFGDVDALTVENPRPSGAHVTA